MYQTALLLLLIAGLVPPTSRPFAFVLSASWAVAFCVEKMGGYAFMPLIDLGCFAAMAWHVVRRPSWWSFLAAEMCFASLLCHVAYWLLYGLGLYFPKEYQILLNGLFLLAAMVLVLGGWDVARHLGSILHSISRPRHRRARHAHARSEIVQSRKDAS